MSGEAGGHVVPVFMLAWCCRVYCSGQRCGRVTGGLHRPVPPRGPLWLNTPLWLLLHSALGSCRAATAPLRLLQLL